MPARRVGVLFERLDAPLVDGDQMRKGRVERCAALLAEAAITACHQQPAVREIKEPFRFGPGLEMTGNLAPAVAPHRAGTVVVAADAERHALGGAAGEFRMQQRVELIAVAGGERRVERAGEIGRALAFHSLVPPFHSALSQALRWRNRLDSKSNKS